MATFAERLKYLRNKNHLTQAELSQRIHIERSRIANYETNRREPDFETLETFADFFNVDMDFMLGKSNVPQKAPLTTEDGFTSEEIEIMKMIREIPIADREKVIKMIEIMSK